MRVSGKLAVDTSAVIAYMEGTDSVRSLLESADTIFSPVVVLLSVAQLAKHIITHFTPILAFPLKGEGISSLPLKWES